MPAATLRDPAHPQRVAWHRATPALASCNGTGETRTGSRGVAAGTRRGLSTVMPHEPDDPRLPRFGLGTELLGLVVQLLLLGTILSAFDLL
jgi:hypothetical protein